MDTIVLLSKLGTVITKIIVTVWFENSDIKIDMRSDVTSDFISMLGQINEDYWVKKGANRHFSGIADNIAQNLEPIIKLEARNLEANSRVAVLNAVLDTIANINIDLNLLLKLNYDPNLLEKHILESSKYIKGLSKNEVWLFNIMIAEVSQHIILISTRLPEFSQNSIVEILKRTDETLQIVEELLITWESIRQNSIGQSKTEDEARFQTKYKSEIERKLGEVVLFGIDANPSSSRYALSRAYISLNVRNNVGGVVSIDKFISTKSRVMVRGAPGSGKTTFLQWLSICAVTNSFPLHLQHLNGKVPFFIRLREFVDKPLPTPSEFVKTTSSVLADIEPDNWSINLLKQGDCLVLIDGIDEVPEKQRGQVLNWIIELVNTFPDSFFVVSSRIYAAAEHWLSRQSFVSVLIEPMALPEIQKFVKYWHEAVKVGVSNSEDKNQIDSLSLSIMETLKQNLILHELSKTPLLCAMLCALHKDRHRDLPRRRIALYQAACYMLMEGRDKQRNINSNLSFDLEFIEKQALLMRLAYWMMQNGHIRVSRHDAEILFERTFRNFQANHNVPANEIYNYFVQRSGIVREPEVDVLDFVHRTFLEFLTAQAAIDERDIGFLIGCGEDEQWREVLIIAAGLADKKGRETLVSGLISKADTTQSESKRRELYLLAAACCQEAIEIDDSLRFVVEERISHFIPPRSYAEVAEIATTGNLAVPRLAYNEGFSIKQKVMCIETLGRIRGDLALARLEDHAIEDHWKVRQALVNAWKGFDIQEYATRVLANYEKLRLDESWLGIQWLDNLKYLTLSSSSEEALPNMRHLKELVRLSVRQCNSLQRISAVSNLKSLEAIEIRDCPGLVDLSPLIDIPNLQVVLLDVGTPQENIDLIKNVHPNSEITVRLRKYETPLDSIELGEETAQGYKMEDELVSSDIFFGFRDEDYDWLID